MAQIVISPLFNDATKDLFSEEDRGVMFAMFRHPVQRVISLFYYLQGATWEPTFNPIYANMTILDYANSPLIESNFIIRSLVNKMEGPLSPDDVDMAKQILKRKCLIGLVDEFDTSIKGFNDAFDFHPNFNVDVEGYTTRSAKEKRVGECVEQLSGDGDAGSNRHVHVKLSEDSEAYKIIQRKNTWDMMLWEFIGDLYREQQLSATEKDLGFQVSALRRNKK